MATTKKPWTRHKIRTDALKQLSIASKRANGSLIPGVGFKAARSRTLLVNAGLAEEVKTPAADGSPFDTVITDQGRDALVQARSEGW